MSRAREVSKITTNVPSVYATDTELISALTGYITSSTASAVYLSQLEGLAKSSASSTYLTQSSASSNYATKTSPTFTGTSLFENITSSGIMDLTEILETVIDSSITSGSATLNFNNGNIFYISSSPSANFTTNITNTPTTNGKTITITVLVLQGATGYIPNIFAINNSIQTIKWSAGVTPTPTSSAGKIDIFNFTLVRRSDTWTVFGTSSLNF